MRSFVLQHYFLNAQASFGCPRLGAGVLAGILVTAALPSLAWTQEPVAGTEAVPTESVPAAAALPAEATAESMGADEIAQWVERLDSELFDTRERAQRTLTDVGKPALAAVVETAHRGSLESSTRAINILLSWSEADDHALVIAALEQLAAMENHPKQAHAAKELLIDVREEIALEEFKKLGGRWQIDFRARSLVPMPRVENRQVIIGADWRGDVEGLHLLERMPHVTTVSFHSPPLGDKALEILERLPQVKLVDLYGVKRMTEPAIAAIQEKLPGVTFDIRRSGAFLGVQGSFGDHAQVGYVVKGSAAEAAGLKKDDVITKFEGQEINDFQTLTALIAEHEPGDTVTLTVMRQGANGLPEMMDLKVTFDQWGKDGAGALDRSKELPQAFQRQMAEPAPMQLDRR